MIRAALLASLIVAASAASMASAEGTLVAWSPQSIEEMTDERWSAAKTRDAAAILHLNVRASSWADCSEVLLGANAQPENESLTQGLVGQLSDRAASALSGTSQLIIWERISSGEILFEGKGYQVEDDLFRVAGRANWVLRMVHKKNYGYVKPDSTSEQIEALSQRWRAYHAGQSPEEWRSPFETDEKGLDEIRSLAALEALIVSLQPSPRKEAYVKRCLREVYGLDEMPPDPRSQPRMCRPESWVYSYLFALTYVREKQSPAWWATWWTQEKSGLVWNRTEGRFATGKP